MRVTLANISEQTGISVPTISKVLNGRPDVSPSTRERVETALAAAGYQPRRRGGRRERAGTAVLDLVVPLDSPGGLVIVEAVERSAYATGHAVVVMNACGRNRASASWVESLRERGSPGVILALDPEPAQINSLDAMRLPHVVMAPLKALPTHTPAVGGTDWAAGVAATEHLLELGHRRIATISGPAELAASQARVHGYRAALASHNLRLPPGFVRFARFDTEAGVEQATKLLSMPQRPTALFCASDLIGLGAFEAASRLGLHVPEDLSIVGFGDLPQAVWIRPSLTTVREPRAEMAALAIRILLKLIDGESPDATRVQVATELVARGTTAPPSVLELPAPESMGTST